MKSSFLCLLRFPEKVVSKQRAAAGARGKSGFFQGKFPSAAGGESAGQSHAEGGCAASCRGNGFARFWGEKSPPQPRPQPGQLSLGCGSRAGLSLGPRPPTAASRLSSRGGPRLQAPAPRFFLPSAPPGRKDPEYYIPPRCGVTARGSGPEVWETALPHPSTNYFTGDCPTIPCYPW